MATDLYKINIKLEADNKKLLASLEKSNRKLGSFEKRAKRAKKALSSLATVGGAAAVALGAGLAFMTAKVINAADEIGKLSQRSGLSVETLSRLKFQAQLTGGSFEEMTKGVRTLQVAMFDAEQGLKRQADAFDALGVPVTNAQGNLRDTETVMMDVAEQFKNMQDGARKAALAQVLFGKAGAKMIPFLNAGRDGIKAMADEADALGLTLDSKLTAAAERTNDNLTRMKSAIEGVFLRVIAKVLPHIEDMTKSLVAWAKESGNVEKAVSILGGVFKGFATVAVVLSGVLKATAKLIGGIAAAVVSLAEGEFSRAADIIGDTFGDIVDEGKASANKLSKIWTDVPKDIVAKKDEIAKNLASPVVAASDIVEFNIKKITANLNKFKSRLKRVSDEAKALNKEFNDRAASLTAGKQKEGKDLNVLDVSLLDLQAKKALKGGDFSGAVDKAREAFDLLDKMKAAGVESDLVLKGMGDSLARLGEEIGQQKLDTLKARFSVDIEQAKAAAAQGNAAMQEFLTANPLVQKVIMQQDGQPQSATATTAIEPANIPQAGAGRADAQDLTPVNITMPNGEVVPFFGDRGKAQQLQRDIQREALKRGTR